MTTNYTGSRWYKFDIHTHTPASSDYPDKTDTEIQWLEALMNEEVDCVAVTDHVSGEWIDRLKSTYQEIDQTEEWFRPLTIFPGVEITFSIGTTRKHVLAVFDPSANTAKINGVLGQCGVVDGHGDAQDTCATESIENIIKIVDDAGGVVIPAHIDGVKGLLEGVVNTNPEIKRWLRQIHAAEFIDLNFLDGVNAQLKADANHLAKLRGSDAHNLARLGKVFTWVKMGRPSVSGLKLALHDHVYCIDNDNDDPNVTPNLFIEELNVVKLKHCGMIPGAPAVFKLHPLFNAIIGGRGTGKSTFVESLRVALGRVGELSQLPDINADVGGFIQGVSTSDSAISLKLHRREETYLCKWNVGLPQSIFKRNGEDWDVDNGNPQDRFNISIYSQKQINALAKNPNSLLDIIDRSDVVNHAGWKVIFDQAVEGYISLSQQERQLIQKVSNEATLLAQLDDVKSDIASFERGGHGDLFKSYQSNSAVSTRLDRTGKVDGFIEAFESIQGCQVASLELSELQDEGAATPEGQELLDLHQAFVTAVDVLKTQTDVIKQELQRLVSNRGVGINASNWKQEADAVSQQYEIVSQEYAERGEALDPVQYESWVSQRNIITTDLEEIDGYKTQLNEIAARKSKGLKKIYLLRRRLQQRRSKFIEQILGGNQYVQMMLEPFADTDLLEKQFRTLINTEDSFARSIYQEGDERTLLHDLVVFGGTFTDRRKLTDKIKSSILSVSKGEPVDTYMIDTRLGSSLGEKSAAQPEIFDRLACWWPDDRLIVKYARDPGAGRFESIDKGSAGQKAAAILAFLLSHGDNPIIVDQPEDDLDNALIYRLIVSQIHENKKRRQIIMVTHNPNIVVNGDAELVNVLEFNNGQVTVANSGGLCDDSIRENICDIMEGGVEAFEKRYQRIVLQ
jgi:predicted ATPase